MIRRAAAGVDEARTGKTAAVGKPILCVDDDPHVRGLIVRLLEAAGHECVDVGDVDAARAMLARREFALVLCDITMPGQSGLDLLSELSRLAPDVATVMVTARDDPGLADAALELGAYGYVTKPFTRNELLIDVANALHRRRLELEQRTYESGLEETVAARTAELEDAVRRLRRSESQLRRAYSETIARLGRAIEYYDGETGAHVERVAAYARAIAQALGLESKRTELVHLAAPLHDIGKIAIGDSILLKDGSLTEPERRQMERHAEVGYALLAGSGNELLELAATIALTHHERWDGTGYPRRLAGDQIPLEGRIVAVADVFDALTSDRPYRSGLPVAEARAYVASERGKGFDPGVVDAFLHSLEALVVRRNGIVERREEATG